MFQRLPTALAQKKQVITSENLLSKIKLIAYSLCQTNKITQIHKDITIEIL